MKIKKLGVVLLMVCFIFTSVGIQAYAAEIGDQLLEPESGWKRYDDNHENITYLGEWKSQVVWNGNYNNTHHFGPADTENTESSFKFRFYGTKFRIISYAGPEISRENNGKVTVDGVEVERLTYCRSSDEDTILVYELVGLEEGVHDVLIEKVTPNTGLGLDAIDIDDTGELIGIPDAPTNLSATSGNEKVKLSWDKVQYADSYKVLRSTTEGGPYKTIEENISELDYLDSGLENDTTYYYVVVAVNFLGESEYSNEASATPEGDSSSGDNALLKITMSNGKINEYDLSMSDVEDFIDWYEDRADDRGKPYYIIEKDYNVGPFESRKDYIAFDKILQFEVMEYNK